VQRKSYAGARELTRGIAVKDDLAIARNLRSLDALTVLLQPTGIDTNGTENALTFPRTTPAALQINDQDFFASVQPLFELFGCDARQSKFAQKAVPANKLAADVDTESSDRNDRQQLSHSSCVGNRAIQVFAEDVPESGISA
jgi:hypothetical protein